MRPGKKESTNFIDYTQDTMKTAQRRYLDFLHWKVQNPHIQNTDFLDFNPFAGGPYDGFTPSKGKPLSHYKDYKPSPEDVMIVRDLLSRLPKGKIFK